VTARSHGGPGPVSDILVEGNLTVSDGGRAFPDDCVNDEAVGGIEAIEPSAAVVPLLSNTEDWIAAAYQQLQDPNLELNSLFAIPTNVLKDILSSRTCNAGTGMFRQDS